MSRAQRAAKRNGALQNLDLQGGISRRIVSLHLVHSGHTLVRCKCPLSGGTADIKVKGHYFRF